MSNKIQLHYITFNTTKNMYGPPPTYGAPAYGAPAYGAPGYGAPPPAYGYAPQPPPPAYYPQQQQQQQGPMIINLGNNNNNSSSGSACGVCGRETESIPRKKIGGTAILWCVCLFFLAGASGLCLIPFCTDGCKDTELICVKCQTVKNTIAANCC